MQVDCNALHLYRVIGQGLNAHVAVFWNLWGKWIYREVPQYRPYHGREMFAGTQNDIRRLKLGVGCQRQAIGAYGVISYGHPKCS